MAAMTADEANLARCDAGVSSARPSVLIFLDGEIQRFPPLQRLRSEM